MKMKSAKTAMQGAARSMSEWAKGQEAPASHQMDYLVERWKYFEKEMDSARNNRDGPLKWTAPPNRNPDAMPEGTTYNTNIAPSPIQAQNVQTPDAIAETQSVKPTVSVDKPKMERDIQMSAEEGRAELARYLRSHQQEVDAQREFAKKRWDRMVFRNLPKLEKHAMINPQKLFTPSAKLRFDNTQPKVPAFNYDSAYQTPATQPQTYQPQPQTYQPQPQTYQSQSYQTPATETMTTDSYSNQSELNTSAYTTPEVATPHVATSEPKKKVLTKLAAWSKSLEPPLPEPQKPVQPPNVLQVITTKVNTSQQETKTEYDNEVSSSSSEEEPRAVPTRLPPLVEHLQSTSNESRLPHSPYPVVPYAQRHFVPTPSADPWMIPRGKKKLQKPPMSFESPLTSIERRMDIPQIHSPPYTVSFS